MAIESPSIKQIYANIINDIETETGRTIPLLSKMFLKILSLALAGVWIILYKYASDAFKQRFPQTANETFLSFLGELAGVSRQSATYFSGVVSCVGTTASGIISANTQLINNKSGNIYLVTESVYIKNGSFPITIKASSNGANYNLTTGDVLNFVSPLFGVSETATLSSTVTLGQDAEDIESYRERVITAYKRKPQGGSAIDLKLWGEEPSAIKTVYPYTNQSYAGIADVYVESETQTDGIPTTDELNLCKSYIDFDPETGLASRRPITMEINYYPIIRKAYDVLIVGLSPDTVANRDLATSAIENYFLELEPYILGVSTSRNSTVSTATLTSAVQNVLTPVEAFFSNLRIEYATDIVYSEELARGMKAKAGDITYV